MRRILLVLVFAVPTAARAQNLSLNAHATVTSSVTVVRLGDLTFGAVPIVPGATASVAPANGGLARVDFNEPASITLPAFVMLGGPSSGQLRVDLTCAQAATAGEPAPTLFSSGCAGGFTPTLAGNIGASVFVYVGGAVTGTSSSSALAGSYAGSVLVTATYVVY